MKEQEQPLITIVTPSYNQGQFIEETIQSVLNQTYKNVEYIIIDGDSTDHTMSIVNSYKDDIDIIISEKDNGQTDAINKGFKLAKGELVGWLNSDDIFYPDCVEKIVELYNNNKDGVIFYGSIENHIDNNSEILRVNTLKIPNRNFLLNKNYSVIQQGSFYSTNVVINCNYLDININYCMDLDLWLRLLVHGEIYSFDDKALTGFRFWEGTKTNNGGKYFLKDIRNTLIKYGAGVLSPNMIRTYIQELKSNFKKFSI